MKKYILLLIPLLITQVILAEDSSEKDVPTSPLSISSWGFSVGGMRALSKELKGDISKNVLHLSLAGSFAIRDYVSLFIDATLIKPKTSYGGIIGADLFFSDTDFRPFVGAGIGGYVMEHSGEFRDDFGPAITAHLGITVDLTENVTLRIRAPYHYVMNEYSDQTAGLDVAFLFSSKYKHVKKLDYNRK